MIKLLKFFAILILSLSLLVSPSLADDSPYQDDVEAGIDAKPYMFGTFECKRIYGTPYVLAETKLHLNPGPIFPQYGSNGKVQGATTRDLPVTRWMLKHRMRVKNLFALGENYMVTLANLGYYLHAATILDVGYFPAAIQLGMDSFTTSNNSVYREVFQQNRWNSVFSERNFNAASRASCSDSLDKKRSIQAKTLESPIYSTLRNNAPADAFLRTLPIGNGVRLPTKPPMLRVPIFR